MNIFYKVKKTGQMNCPVFGVDLIQRCIQAVDPPAPRRKPGITH